MSVSQRIAFVCPRFTSGSSAGGAETLLKNLAHRARMEGRDIAFLTTCAEDHFTWKNSKTPGERVIDDLPVHFFPVDEDRDTEAFMAAQSRISMRCGHTQEDEKTWISNSVNSPALCEFLARNSNAFDRVVTGPYLFGLTYSVSNICPEKTILLPCLHDEGFAYVDLIADMFRNVSGLIFNSKPEMDLAIRLYGLDPESCRVVGMGLDPVNVSRDAFAKKHAISAPYVLYSGRRESAKGTPMLCDYMAAWRERTGIDIKLVLTGSGPVEAPPELDEHIFDAGFVTEQEKHEAMAGALVFCHPSVNESLSIVLLESWLAGTPALVHAGCAVTRAHCSLSGGGLWFGNYPEFEEELLLLAENDELRIKMAGSGRDYVLREYTWDVVTRRLLDALDASPSGPREGNT